MQDNNYQNQQPQGNPYAQNNPYTQVNQQQQTYSQSNQGYSPNNQYAQPVPYPKTKEPFQLGKVMQLMFSPKPYEMFKMKLDTLSMILLLALSVFFTALANYRRIYYSITTSFVRFNFWFFLLAFLISIFVILLIKGAIFGYGILLQGKAGTGKQRSLLSIETLALAVIPSIIFNFWAFIFSFFWYTGWAVFSMLGLISMLLLFLDGLELRIGKKLNTYWYKIALLFVVVVLYVVAF